VSFKVSVVPDLYTFPLIALVAVLDGLVVGLVVPNKSSNGSASFFGSSFFTTSSFFAWSFTGSDFGFSDSPVLTVGEGARIGC